MPVEQAIAVPKISLDRIPQRSFVLTPQSAEQLVEVPTVLTPTRIALQIAEQIVAIPVLMAGFMVPSQVRVLPLVEKMSERRCPRSGCCFAWERTVCGTGCRRAAPAFRLPGVLQALGSSGVTGPLLL